MQHPCCTDRADKSLDLFPEVIATKNAVFLDNQAKSACSIGSKGGWHNASRTFGNCHDGADLRTAGLLRKIPFRNFLVQLCVITDTPPGNPTWNAVIAVA